MTTTFQERGGREAPPPIAVSLILALSPHAGGKRGEGRLGAHGRA